MTTSCKKSPKPVQLITYNHKYAEIDVTTHNSEWEALKELIDYVQTESRDVVDKSSKSLVKFMDRRVGSCAAGWNWLEEQQSNSCDWFGIAYSIVKLRLPKGWMVTKVGDGKRS